MRQHRPEILTVTAFAIGLIAPVLPASAGLKNIYEFCSQPNCTDGQLPTGVISDQDGNIYGTANEGGEGQHGVVFELTPTARGGYKYSVIYAFCPYRKCHDGAEPTATLIIDSSGSLYGVTSDGGTHQGGAVYELSPSAGQWVEKVLYSFCSQSYCNDGESPGASLSYQGAASGAPYDGTSALYGTTELGGTGQEGVVFSLEPSDGSWTEQTLYSFVSPNQPVGLAVDASGNLFGALANGGKLIEWAGGIFKLTPSRSGWKERPIYDFCHTAKCTSGASAVGSPYIDSSGRIWATTSVGGYLPCVSNPNTGCGTIALLTPGPKAYQETTFHTFCETDCTDGASPVSGLQSDSRGNLFGTAVRGARDQDGGSLFELSGSQFITLHTFCLNECKDGNQPRGGLVLGRDGSVIGVTSSGAYAGNTSGAIYKFTP